MATPSILIGKLLGLPGKLVVRTRRRGALDTLRWACYQFSWRLREWRLGIRTGQYSQGVVLEDDGDCRGYEPVDFLCFDIAMENLDIRPGEDVFLDYGCGKGRAVILAATHPFRRVLGVERSARMCDVAGEQVRRAGRKLVCKDVEIVHADATTYELPTDVTVVFLYNSFGGSVLEAALERIRRSLEAVPRKLSIIYMTPYSAPDGLAECDWLQEVCQLPSGFRINALRFQIYESLPEHANASVEPPVACPLSSREDHRKKQQP